VVTVWQNRRNVLHTFSTDSSVQTRCSIGRNSRMLLLLSEVSDLGVNPWFLT
jgi:hypothetical protein